MKVSHTWLQEYFDEPLPKPEELANLLTFHSYEIENIEKVGNDTVIDVDVLPNRSSDSLSHRGIAREIATLLDVKLKKDPLTEEVPTITPSRVCDVVVEDVTLCDNYSLAVIRGVKVAPSPAWLVERLETLGQRSINNVVDATNYVMLNIGQPLHAFDADKLEGREKLIRVRSAKKGEIITTLTDDEYILNSETLLITDGNADEPIGIAGVKGGKRAEVDGTTSTIVLEAAHFNFVSIRKTAGRLKLWTDASMRFQNDPSCELVSYALRDVIALILDIAGGELEGGASQAKASEQREPVRVTLSQVNGLLGTTLEADKAEAILTRLGFTYEKSGETYRVVAPFERTDVSIPEDVIEEVGRVHGYEHLEARELPQLERDPDVHKGYYWADRIRNVLVEAGYSEVLGYAFRNKGDIEVAVPLAEDKAFLRTDLAAGMREYLEKNQKNAPLFGSERVMLFEIGEVFPKEGEHASLAIGVSGKGPDKLLGEAKELLEGELGVAIIEDPKDGVLEMDLTNVLNELPDGEAYDAFETNLTQFQPFSLYPFILRDIAVWVPSETDEDSVRDIIARNGGKLLVRSDIFDTFEKDGKTSYAYHLVFQSNERTLTDDEAGKIMDNITADLNKKEGFEVR